MTDDPQVTHPKARPQKLTARFGLAVAFANQLHRRQIRKGSGIPYMSHLLGVASLALEHGANEDEAIAAVLHDAVEDQDGTLWYYQALIGAYRKADAAVALAANAPKPSLAGRLGNWRGW